MAEAQSPPAGSDLEKGVAPDFEGDTLLGHVGDQDVLLVRSGPVIYAIDAHCSHYHGPLAGGLAAAAPRPFLRRGQYRASAWNERRLDRHQGAPRRSRRRRYRRL